MVVEWEGVEGGVMRVSVSEEVVDIGGDDVVVVVVMSRRMLAGLVSGGKKACFGREEAVGGGSDGADGGWGEKVNRTSRSLIQVAPSSTGLSRPTTSSSACRPRRAHLSAPPHRPPALPMTQPCLGSWLHPR